MTLTLDEAKNLYVLLYFEAIDGKEFFMDKLEEFICDKEPAFDIHTYLLSIGWTLKETNTIENIEEFFALRSEKIVPIKERWDLNPSDIDSDENAHIWRVEAALLVAENEIKRLKTKGPFSIANVVGE